MGETATVWVWKVSWARLAAVLVANLALTMTLTIIYSPSLVIITLKMFQATTTTPDSVEIKEVNNCKLRENTSILSSFGSGEI